MKAIPHEGPDGGATRRAGDAAFQQGVAALHSDRRNIALLDIAATFAFMAGVIYVLVRYPGPFTYVLAFIGIGLMQYRIVVACHEAVHKALLYPLFLNEVVGSVHCALVGINLFWYRFQHLYHHAAKDVGHDPDAYIYEPILRARPGFHRLLVWVFGTAPEAIEKLRQKGIAVSTTKEANNGMARFYSFAIVLVQAVLLLACTLWLFWWYYFAFWLAPLLTIAIFMNRTRVFVEHGYVHVKVHHNLADSSTGAIDLSATFLERFFIAPYMINYHFSHHRVPSIPYHRVSDLSRLLAERGEVAPSCPTYARALHHLLWH